MYFRFIGRHREFPTSAYIFLSAIELDIIENMVVGFCNFDPNMFASRDTYISGLTTAMLDFRLPLKSDIILSDIDRIEYPRKHGSCLWNFDLSCLHAQIHDVSPGI